MTEKQRLKHEADNHRVGPSARLIGSEMDALEMRGFREPKTPPRLSWLNAKMHSGFIDRKHAPGRKPEQTDAAFELGVKESLRLKTDMEKLNDQHENQAIDRAENEGMGAGTRRPEQSL